MPKVRHDAERCVNLIESAGVPVGCKPLGVTNKHKEGPCQNQAPDNRLRHCLRGILRLFTKGCRTLETNKTEDSHHDAESKIHPGKPGKRKLRSIEGEVMMPKDNQTEDQNQRNRDGFQHQTDNRGDLNVQVSKDKARTHAERKENSWRNCYPHRRQNLCGKDSKSSGAGDAYK